MHTHFEKDALSIAQFKSTSTALQDLNEMVEIVASPNPTKDIVTFQLELPEAMPHLSIQIYGLTGQLIEEIQLSNGLSSGPHQFKMNLSDLSSGLYVYKVSSNQRLLKTDYLTITN